MVYLKYNLIKIGSNKKKNFHWHQQMIALNGFYYIYIYIYIYLSFFICLFKIYIETHTYMFVCVYIYIYHKWLNFFSQFVLWIISLIITLSNVVCLQWCYFWLWSVEHDFSPAFKREYLINFPFLKSFYWRDNIFQFLCNLLLYYNYLLYF